MKLMDRCPIAGDKDLNSDGDLYANQLEINAGAHLSFRLRRYNRESWGLRQCNRPRHSAPKIL